MDVDCLGDFRAVTVALFFVIVFLLLLLLPAVAGVVGGPSFFLTADGVRKFVMLAVDDVVCVTLALAVFAVIETSEAASVIEGFISLLALTDVGWSLSLVFNSFSRDFFSSLLFP